MQYNVWSAERKVVVLKVIGECVCVCAGHNADYLKASKC